MIQLASDAEGAAAPLSLAERMARAFSQEGALAKSPDFEFRPQQQRMARLVARALETKRGVVIEAPTGVGKSLAYLLPSVSHALEEKRKAIICTHTINLQEQLLQKDLPIVRKLMGREFSALLLKGRSNYVCPQRLARAFDGSSSLFTSSEGAELKKIWEWSEKTTDGTLGSLDFTPSPKVWSQVCSEPHVCTPRRCMGKRCFYQEARRKVGEADVVILNHTLFFTLLSSVEEVLPEDANFLFPKDFLIVDEAHTIENVAARACGLHLSEGHLRFELQRLFNPRTRKGLFPLQGEKNGADAVVSALDAMGIFFRAAEASCQFHNHQAREYRVREPELVEDTLSAALFRVSERAIVAGDAAKAEHTRLELHDLARRLKDARTTLKTFLDQDEDGHVYWVERSGGESRSLAFHSAPVDVSGYLGNLFFRNDRACVLTSATLGVGDDQLDYFRKRVGAMDSPSVKLASPFDFEEQMRLYVVKNIPAPGTKEHEQALPEWIEHFLELSQGRAFVLFTSYTQMTNVADRVEDFCDKKGWRLLVQGRGLPRHQLLNEFKEDTHSVLFGTDSFWTGVDVPGDSLSNVIITKLPFAVPDHPLTAARLERIEEDGGNPFTEYSVPEAILKLRQGVGRLIRSKKDRGICAILDNRVLTKPYGRAFLSALPQCPVEIVGAKP
jgi:ATP-dependent DNA helicase DinG